MMINVWRTISIGLLVCVVVPSAHAGTRRVHGHPMAPAILRIEPASLLFEVDAATATIVPPVPYPKFLHVYGRNFSAGAHICANGVPVKTRFLSKTHLSASLQEIEKYLKTDTDNTRLSAVEITVIDPGPRQKPSQPIRFTHFVEGNAGG